MYPCTVTVQIPLVAGMHVWEYSDWLLDKYPGLLFVSVEVCAKALRSSGKGTLMHNACVYAHTLTAGTEHTYSQLALLNLTHN